MIFQNCAANMSRSAVLRSICEPRAIKRDLQPKTGLAKGLIQLSPLFTHNGRLVYIKAYVYSLIQAICICMHQIAFL